MSLEQMIVPSSRYQQVRRGDFGFCQTASVHRDLDSWVRRRLRSVAWKQSKSGQKLLAELTARGVGKDLAAQTAGSPHDLWRLARGPALSYAFSNAYLQPLGLPDLALRPTA